MREPFKESIRKNGIKANFLSLKAKFRKAIQNKRILTNFSISKRDFRGSIYAKSWSIRQSSLKEILRESIHNSVMRTRLTFGLAWRNATRSKYRSFLLIFGILLTIALETGIVVSVDTLYDDFLFDHRNQNYTDITVHPDPWLNLSALEALAKDIQKTPGVAKASPVYYAKARDILNESISQSILLFGIDSKTHPDFPHLNLIKGIREVSDYTIIISQTVRDLSNKDVGEEIGSLSEEIDFGDVTVGGIISDTPFFANKLGSYFILVDIYTLMDVIPENRQQELTCEIDVSVKSFINIKETGENVKDKVGIENLVSVEKDFSEIKATGIRAYQTAMNLVIIASFFVEFLFITNILAIAIKDRQREFGILRAVGTDSKQLVEVIAIEILIYSVIGSTLGLIVGIGFSNVLIHSMSVFYPTLVFESISIHSSSLIATFSSGIIVALISGLYPIFLAITMPVIQNIHSRMRTAKSFDLFTNWKYSVGAGLLLALTGFLLQFFVGPSRFLDFEILSIHFLVVIMIFLGTLLLEVGILIFLPRVAMRVLFWFGIVTRSISTRNIAREFQKSLFTILTSALALTFIIVVGLTSAAVIAAVPDYFESQWGGIELVMEGRDTQLPFTNFTQELDIRQDIRRSSFIQETRTEIGGEDGYVFGVDPIKYSHFAEPVLETIDDEQLSYLYLNETTEEIPIGNTTITRNVTNGIITHLLYQRIRPKIPLGSNISLKITENQTVNITLSAVILGNIFLGDGEYLYIATDYYEEYFNSTLAKWFVCNVQGDVGTAQANIEKDYDRFTSVMGITFYKEVIERSLIFQSVVFQVLFIESFILAAIAQFVCILVSTLRMEREMGIMRSLGLNKRGVFGIFMAESTALGLSALVVGLIDGLLGSVLLSWYISLSITNIVIQFPFDRILLWVVISFLITLASTILPSYRSSQRNLVATISGRPMVRSYIEKLEKPYMYDKKPFYPFWSKGTDTSPFFENPSGLSKTPTPKPRYLSQSYVDMTDIAPSISIWTFIKDNKLQIQTIFLILLAIVTLNYIFNENVISRGLSLFDYIWRGVLILGDSGPTGDIMGVLNTNPFLIINPLLLIVGLLAMGPIAFYIMHGSPPQNLTKDLIKSFISGISGILICIILFIIQFIVALFLLIFLTAPLGSITPQEYFEFPLEEVWFFVLIISFGIIIIGIELLVFQRVWVFLIFQGVNSNLSLKQKIKWTRRIASKGQLGFVVLLIVHILLQIVLYVVSQNAMVGNSPLYDDPYAYLPQAGPVDPISFLVLTCFEIGFFLLLIIYQLVQYQKQSHMFTMDDSTYARKVIDTTSQLKLKTSHIAEVILKEEPLELPIERNQSLLFQEELEGIQVLFFQEHSRGLPVAMNYARHWPQKIIFLDTSVIARVDIPSLDQMRKFLDIVNELTPILQKIDQE